MHKVSAKLKQRKILLLYVFSKSLSTVKCFLVGILSSRVQSQTNQAIENASVVLGTLISAHETGHLKNFPTDYFQLTVIDECTQGLEASCYIPVIMSTKLVLAGDHHQLPPTVHSTAKGLSKSLMERMVGE